MLHTILLIGLGILCLILTVIALVFGVIAFANNKTNKFIWLATFLTGLIGLIICAVLVVKKVVNTVSDFTQNTIGQFENYTDSLTNYLDSTSVDKHQINHSSLQIKTLKSYLNTSSVNNEPEEFYTYLGFKDYYRYPLKYPYSIHCMFTKDNGELYNEANVNRFDENDNGEIYSGISNINKIAFDKNYLLIEQTISSTRTDKIIFRYLLYHFDDEKKEEVPSMQKLIDIAKQKGYSGPDTLMTFEQYQKLF
jgi:hypothetical protein